MLGGLAATEERKDAAGPAPENLGTFEGAGGNLQAGDKSSFTQKRVHGAGLCYYRRVFLSLRVPATNERGALYMDHALAAIHQGNPRGLPVILTFARLETEVVLGCRCGDELRPIVESQLYSQYPDCRIDSLSDQVLDPPPDTCTWTVELALTPDLFPIRRYAQFEDALNRVTCDPVGPLLASLTANPGDPLRGRIEIALRPAPSQLRRRAQQCLRRLASPFFRAHPRLAGRYLHWTLSRSRALQMLAWFLGSRGTGSAELAPSPALSTSASRLHEREDDLLAASEKLGRLLFEAHIRLMVAGPPTSATDAERKLREMVGAFGQFSAPRLASFQASPVYRSQGPARRFRMPTFLLSTEEIATLFHPPTLTVHAPTLSTVDCREFEPPVTLPTPERHADLTLLGLTSYRGHRQPFGILPEDRRRHMYVVGKTGMGKSTLLLNLIASDIEAGRGVGLVEPHGDLADAVLAAVPRHRTNDVVLLDAGDTSYPLAFNVLACRSPEQRPLVASGIISAFKKLYADFWGPRMEHILRNALLTLLEIPGASLLTLLRLLGETRFRETLVEKVSDPVVRNFWREFAGMPPKLLAEAISPVTNKIGALLSSPVLRSIFGQARNTLDLRKVMDEGKILIANVSKGRIGEDASTLLGSLLITAIQIAAMSRAEMPEEQRRDYGLFVDEAGQFATDAFPSFLSELRKYHASCILAGQYLAQLADATLAAIFGNCGSLICFQVGAQDAEILATQLGGAASPQDLLQLPRYVAYVRLLINGMPSKPLTMQTLPPTVRSFDPQRSTIIRSYCRQRYGRPAARVAAEIREALTSG